MEHLLEIVERISNFDSRPDDMDLMKSVGGTMEAGSLCGHGQLGFGPIRSAITHFEEDFRSHIEDKKCPTGSCNNPKIVPRSTRPYATDIVSGD
jgi:NADH:ubiquinone oxidoreductase subunit F (NADH-binding)